ncbi:heavy-metal-associated domain-containing protein [Sphingobacterium suaedae]|uniref:Heavy-metal-associated domain-containing protein n=1 Tax=Sphingobacterium suaedae TaxID=1686402 RepID=A0ABW5KHX8_9SPHI
MKTKNLKFKTNINCSGCVAKVTPFLNGAEHVASWEVDTANQNKILTVSTQADTDREIISAVENAGFKIEPLGDE